MNSLYNIRTAALLLAACALGACTNVTVNTDYDHATNFGKYKTFVLAPAPKGEILSPATEATLDNSLRKELVARGITEAPKGKGADLYVVRTVFVKHVVSARDYSDMGYGSHGWPYTYGSYGMWTGAPAGYSDVTQYAEGTLILDFVDAHTKKVVFRGTGTATVGGQGANAAKVEDAVRKIVDEMPR